MDLTKMAQEASSLVAAHWQDAAGAAAKGALTSAGGALFGWLKDRFSGMPEAATLSKLEADSSRGSVREALQAQILMRLEEDEEFRRELGARLGSAGAPGTSQNLEQRGNANRGVQIVGDQNKVEM